MSSTLREAVAAKSLAVPGFSPAKTPTCAEVAAQDKSVEITNELATLLVHKTEFFKTAEHTPDELRAYLKSRQRVRELSRSWRN